MRLGPPDPAGARLAKAMADRDLAEQTLERARAALQTARQTLADAERARDDADVAHAEAREALLQLGAELEAALADERTRRRLDEDAGRKEIRDRSEADEAARRKALDDALGRLGRTSARDLDQARAMRDKVLAALEEDASAAEAAVEDRIALDRERMVSEARDQAAAAVTEATDALEVARRAVRDHRSAVEAGRESQDAPVQAAREAVALARQEREARRKELSVLTERHAAAELFLTRAEASVEAATGAHARAEQALRAATDAVAASQARGEQVQARLAEEQAEARAQEDTATSAREALEAARLKLAEAETARDAAATARAGVEVDAATWAERSRSAAEAMESLAERRDAAVERLKRLQASLEEIRVGLVESTKALADATAEREVADVQRAESWERLERERERLKELRDGVRTAEEDLHRLTEQELALTRKVDGLRARVESVREDIETLRARMDERYQLSVPGLLDQLDARGSLILEPDPAVTVEVEVDGVVIPAIQAIAVTGSDLTDEEGIAERVEALQTARAELERIGDVNLAALDEWTEVRERHADLEAQRADLEASVQRIRAAIAKMNRTCRQRFRDTFDLVNAHFQEMYPRLVGGGAARLSLTDEEDLLETGVDIFVQPPGKRLQNLSLLSGGEKAMTAIALILSLFKVKPSPFCVLDEVDAPLDEANGSRFNEALREMAQHSQFIVVTHNRKTMECAATLYGITMPQPGCSRLVSVQLG